MPRPKRPDDPRQVLIEFTAPDLELVDRAARTAGYASRAQFGREALVDAAKAVLNCRTRDILNQHGASPTFLPSEDVSAWPEYLRRKMERGEKAREEEEKEV